MANFQLPAQSHWAHQEERCPSPDALIHSWPQPRWLPSNSFVSLVSSLSHSLLLPTFSALLKPPASPTSPSWWCRCFLPWNRLAYLYQHPSLPPALRDGGGNMASSWRNSSQASTNALAPSMPGGPRPPSPPFLPSLVEFFSFTFTHSSLSNPKNKQTRTTPHLQPLSVSLLDLTNSISQELSALLCLFSHCNRLLSPALYGNAHQDLQGCPGVVAQWLESQHEH